MQGTQYATKRNILCRGAFCGPTELVRMVFYTVNSEFLAIVLFTRNFARSRKVEIILSFTDIGK